MSHFKMYHSDTEAIADVISTGLGSCLNQAQMQLFKDVNNLAIDSFTSVHTERLKNQSNQKRLNN